MKLRLPLIPGIALLAGAALIGFRPASPNAPWPQNFSLTATPPSSQPVAAVTLSVVDAGLASQITTEAATVGQALWAAGIRLYLADQVRPGFDAPVSSGLTVTIVRSRPVSVVADGYTLSTRTRQATVEGVLSEVGLALVGEDYALPGIGQPIPDDGRIRLVRVHEEVLLNQSIVPFDTVYQAQADWEIDTVQLLQAGRNGIVQHRVRVRSEDGLEVARLDEGEHVALAPVPAIVGYGTNIVLRTVDTPNGPVEYWRSYTMYATSYAAKFLARPPTSPNYGRTASGKILTKGLVAIDRSLIPFGTRMYVPGYGFAEAADTGGGVRGRWIDLGFDDWNYESWHQVVTVYFLTPVPPAGQIRWIIPQTVP